MLAHLVACLRWSYLGLFKGVDGIGAPWLLDLVSMGFSLLMEIAVALMLIRAAIDSLRLGRSV
ncbi:hypothetical protein CSC65_08415 [Pseudoxanthomonas daejeonensis]|uniref:Uncharacterized protein n=1 Tax=Pseudoxanthomonas daejeonensis TaxID=266062 RepID=A0ABQ6Z747_9GAMM|nr:hypothetical protein CSC65_08415 [Pseudoxanthomonas daejeonensis]